MTAFHRFLLNGILTRDQHPCNGSFDLFSISKNCATVDPDQMPGAAVIARKQAVNHSNVLGMLSTDVREILVLCSMLNWRPEISISACSAKDASMMGQNHLDQRDPALPRSDRRA